MTEIESVKMPPKSLLKFVIACIEETANSAEAKFNGLKENQTELLDFIKTDIASEILSALDFYSQDEEKRKQLEMEIEVK